MARILLLDDDRFIQVAVQNLLAGLGWRTWSCRTAPGISRAGAGGAAPGQHVVLHTGRDLPGPPVGAHAYLNKQQGFLGLAVGGARTQGPRGPVR